MWWVLANSVTYFVVSNDHIATHTILLKPICFQFLTGVTVLSNTTLVINQNHFVYMYSTPTFVTQMLRGVYRIFMMGFPSVRNYSNVLQ